MEINCTGIDLRVDALVAAVEFQCQFDKCGEKFCVFKTKYHEADEAYDVYCCPFCGTPITESSIPSYKRKD